MYLGSHKSASLEYTETFHLHIEEQGMVTSKSIQVISLPCYEARRVMVYEAIDIFLLDCACIFDTKILAPLEVLINSLFYHILKIFEMI